VIGIVVVAHSRALAEAAVAFAREMPNGHQVTMVIAAGLDDGTFGTNASEIAAALENADNPDGVLVLTDLGSAVMSAELALELVDDAVRSRVQLCPAPLVEGLVVAVAAAGAGQSLAAVAAQATGAYVPEKPAEQAQYTKDTFDVRNAHGLHLRPASKLVAVVLGFDADVTIRDLTTGSVWAPAGSLSRVTGLGAARGHRMEVVARGAQAAAAVEAVLALAARNFDETGGSAARTAARPGPLAASPGVAIGPMWTPAGPEIAARPAGDPAMEWRQLTDAIALVRADTAGRRDQVERELGAGQADIFAAHLMFLEDIELLAEARRQLDGGRSAAAGWVAAVQTMSDQFAALPDSYQRARAADVRAVGDQVLRQLAGAPNGFESRAGILVADDLTPAEVSGLDPDLVSGIVLAGGSPTGHNAILARARGIPMVVAAGPDILAAAGKIVAMDGATGAVMVNPGAEELASFVWRMGKFDAAREEAIAAADEPARTTDGVRIEVAANLDSIADARSAVAAGADSAGLIRTEFLFLGRAEAPTVDEQEAAYRTIAESFGGRRITLRTLDIGADKPLPYAPTVPEANPFLGLRGIRLALARPVLLRDQLTAIRRVAQDHPVDLMFPMVSTVDELATALAMVGGARPKDLRIGAMIEVPSAALNAAALAPHVDFFSIGTNDLTQYTMAAERGNAAVADLADPYDPAVLRLIDGVVRAAGQRVGVAVCGELAAEALAVPLLIGLGVTELSVTPTAIALVKQAVRQVNRAQAQVLARQALKQPSARTVRELCRSSAID
jgi:phosphocarrier protein FPr